MAQRSKMEGDFLWTGVNTFQSVPTVPASSFGNAEFDAGDPLAATKQVHRYIRSLAQVHGSNATAERRIVHRAHAAGTVDAVRVGPSVAAAGDSTCTVDVKKNGTTILSAPVVIDSSNAAFSVEEGTVSVASYAAGDCLEVVITVSAGTGTLPQGVCADVVVDEAAG